MSIVFQNTLKDQFTLSGCGLHSGVKTNVTFKPAAENTGYVIVRTDLENHPVIPANADYVKDVDRSSCLEKDGVIVRTMEHALAALYGMGVDNCLMEIDGEEFPILDGSSKYYVQEISKVGLEQQSAERHYFHLNEKVEVASDDKSSRICIYPDDHYELTTLVSYDSPYVSKQFASFNELNDNFSADVAPCRTFVFLREVEALLNAGLIKGGALDNAIVIVDREISQEDAQKIGEKFGCPNIKVHQGVLNNISLAFDNEPARHKMLDVMGDLALCGGFIKGRVVADRPGHKLNCKLSKLLYKKIQESMAPSSYPEVDLSAEPLMDINKIRSLLPHRPPFLLVDKIYKVTPDLVVGCKNVTMNEPFFVGHFPDEPVMPGVLMVEAMAQCGGILVLSGVPDPENYSTYFMKIDGIKFRKKVVPGDTLVFKLITTAPTRRGIVSMKGFAFVGKTLVCEGEFMAQVAKTKN